VGVPVKPAIKKKSRSADRRPNGSEVPLSGKNCYRQQEHYLEGKGICSDVSRRDGLSILSICGLGGATVDGREGNRGGP